MQHASMFIALQVAVRLCACFLRPTCCSDFGTLLRRVGLLPGVDELVLMRRLMRRWFPSRCGFTIAACQRVRSTA